MDPAHSYPDQLSSQQKGHNYPKRQMVENFGVQFLNQCSALIGQFIMHYMVENNFHQTHFYFHILLLVYSGCPPYSSSISSGSTPGAFRIRTKSGSLRQPLGRDEEEETEGDMIALFQGKWKKGRGRGRLLSLRKK